MSISRRQALNGAATVGLAAGLAACAGDEGTATGGSDPTSRRSTRSEPSPTGSAPSAPRTTEEAPSPQAPGALVATAEVPVGGGVVIGEEEVVVTQPAKGEFRAFSALCTHQGCLLARVEAEEIQCDCHGSRFAIGDGAVVSGPAASPLSEVEIVVRRGRIQRA